MKTRYYFRNRKLLFELDMDFIFIALAFQLVFLFGIIVIGSDKSKIKSRISSALKTNQIHTFMGEHLKKIFGFSSQNSKMKVAPTANLRSEDFFDCEVKTIEAAQGENPFIQISKICQKETSSNTNLLNTFHLLACSFFSQLSTKGIALFHVFKNMYLFVTSRISASDAEIMDFSQFTTPNEMFSPEYGTMISNSSPSFRRSVKSGFVYSPFRHNELHLLIKRRIKRKLALLDLSIMKIKKGAKLPVIQELPELENGQNIGDD